MGIAYLDITPELFVELLKGLAAGEDVRYWQVVEDGLPADVEFVQADVVRESECIRMKLQSAEFTDGEQLKDPMFRLCSVDGGDPPLQIPKSICDSTLIGRPRVITDSIPAIGDDVSFGSMKDIEKQ